MLTFLQPLWLLGIPLPWLLAKIAASSRAKGDNTPALRHPAADVIAQLAQQDKSRVPWLWWLGCAALVTALAQPVWLDATNPNTAASRNIMLLLDTSASMRAEDFVWQGRPVSRFVAMQNIVETLLSNNGDRIGIIAFGDEAFTLTPPTTDHHVLRGLIKELEPGFAGDKTALGDALLHGAERLAADASEPEHKRALVVLTDGSNTAGATQPEQALPLLIEKQVAVYTIGIGSHRPVPFPRTVVQNPAITELPFDEALLQNLASETGGQYFSAGNTDALRSALQSLEQSRPRTAESNKSGTAFYWIPLLCGLLLLATSFHGGQWRTAPGL